MNILEYDDYKHFLRDYISIKKSQRSSWSLGVFANSLSLKSPSTLSMIINGERHPNSLMTEKLCVYLGFKDKEKEYFETLVTIQKKLKNKKLSLFLINNVKDNLNSSEDLYLLPVTFIVKELILQKNFKNDPAWIKDQILFNTSENQISKIISFLQNEKIIYCNDGQFQFDDIKVKKLIKSKDDIFSLHSKLLEITKDIYKSKETTKRLFQTSFLSISQDELENAISDIRKKKQEFTTQYDSKNGEIVYQLNMQLFPVTNPKK